VVRVHSVAKANVKDKSTTPPAVLGTIRPVQLDKGGGRMFRMTFIPRYGWNPFRWFFNLPKSWDCIPYISEKEKPNA